MDRKVADALIYEMPERRRFVRGLRAYAGFRQIGVTYERDRRHAGQAKYTLRKLFRLALDGLFDFSTFPLRIATYLGFFIAVPAFLVGVFLVLRVSLGLPFLGAVTNELPSVPILATGLFLQGGVTLIVLGIVGEYLGRIYQEVKRRPAFIVAEEYPVQPSPARVPAAD